MTLILTAVRLEVNNLKRSAKVHELELAISRALYVLMFSLSLSPSFGGERFLA